MKYNLILAYVPDFGQTYCLRHHTNKDGMFSCFEELADYFHLRDMPKLITVKVTKKSHKDSYFCKTHYGHNKTIMVKLTSGKHIAVWVYTHFYNAINHFPKGCYVSVIA